MLLIVNQHYSIAQGGSELQCEYLAEELKGASDFLYVAIGGVGSSEPGYNYIEVFGILDIVRVLAKKDLKIYWRHNKKFLLISVIISKFYGNRFVFASSSLGDFKPLGKLYYTQFTFRSALRQIRLSLSSILNYLGLYFVDHVIVLNKKYMRMLPGGCSSDVVYDSMPLSFESIDLPKRPYVIWVANLKAQKRPELFIQLAVAYAERFANNDLLFVMVGAHNSDYDYVSDLELDNFIYLGKLPVAQVNTLIGASQLLIHTCTPEGFGNNFIQAWLQSVRTLSYSFDPDDFITEYNLGMVGNNTFDDFFDKFVSMIEDNDRIDENNLLQLEKFFDVKINTRKILSILNK